MAIFDRHPPQLVGATFAQRTVKLIPGIGTAVILFTAVLDVIHKPLASSYRRNTTAAAAVEDARVLLPANAARRRRPRNCGNPS